MNTVRRQQHAKISSRRGLTCWSLPVRPVSSSHTVGDGGSQSSTPTYTLTQGKLHRVTVHCSPLVAFFRPLSPESITCLPLSASWGATSTVTNRWNTDSRELWHAWETQKDSERRTGREMCLLAKSYTLCDSHSKNHVPHISLYMTFSIWQHCIYFCNF